MASTIMKQFIDLGDKTSVTKKKVKTQTTKQSMRLSKATNHGVTHKNYLQMCIPVQKISTTDPKLATFVLPHSCQSLVLIGKKKVQKIH